MERLELLLTHRLGEGAVFLDTLTQNIYVMHNAEDELHPYNEEKDKSIKYSRDLDKPIPAPNNPFDNLDKAANYVRALATFENMVNFVIRFYEFKEYIEVKDNREQVNKSLQDMREDIRKRGYKEILTNVPIYNTMIGYLEMTPEEILQDLSK